MTTFVKICGICSESDLEQILAFKPDALGFVVWEKSKRYISPEQIGAWEIPATTKKVGVFVEPTSDEILSAVQKGKLDVVQIHRKSDAYEPIIPSEIQVEIWGAFQPHELDEESKLFQVSDKILLDAFDAETIGGTGKTCDWEKAFEIVNNCKKPVLLAGGLTTENVAEAIEKVQPFGVDVSSSLEISPGKKSIEKVEQFIKNARTK